MNKVYTLYITGHPDQSFSDIGIMKQYVRDFCSSKTKEEIDKLEILFDDKNVFNFKEQFGDEKLGLQVSYGLSMFNNAVKEYSILGELPSMEGIIEFIRGIRYREMMHFRIDKIINEDPFKPFVIIGNNEGLIQALNYFGK